MGLKDVNARFDQVVHELEEVKRELAERGAAAFQHQDYATISDLNAASQSLGQIREQVASVRSEWTTIAQTLAATFSRRGKDGELAPKISVRAALASRVNVLLLIAFGLTVLGQCFLIYNNKPETAPRNQIGLVLHGMALLFAIMSLRRNANDTAEPETVVPLPRSTEAALVGGLLLLAVLTRTLWLSRVPYILDGDTGAFAESALQYTRPNPPGLFDTGWQGHTNSYFFLLSLPLRVFGQTIIGLRALSAFGGILAVLSMYLLGRSLFDWRVGLLAGLTTATLPFHLVFSRVGTEVVHLTWLLPLVIVGIWEGWRRESLWLLLASGAVAGISQYFYPGARLIPILCGVQVVALTLFPVAAGRRWRYGLQSLGWVMLGFVVVYAPMIAYYLQHPDTYMARFNIVSITRSGWLERELANRSMWDVMSQQFKQAYGPFLFPTQGSRYWYLAPQYLSPINAALLFLGLISLGARRIMPRWLGVFLAFYLVVGIFLGGVLIIDTPMPSRYIVFIPAIVLLISVTLNRLLHQFTGLPNTRARRIAGVVASVGLLLLTVSNVRAYVRHDTTTIWEMAIEPQIASAATRYLIALPDQNYTVLYLKDDRNYFQANPSLYVLTKKDGINIDPGTTCEAMAQQMPPGQTVIVAPPSRIEELGAIKTHIIGADATILKNKKGDNLAGVLHFTVPPEGISQYLCSGTPN